MAHTLCPLGHDMWNGDGGPVIEAFRVGFIREFAKEHPDCLLGEIGEYWGLQGCVHKVPGEDLDCWYCDECKGLVVFADSDSVRYDFKRMENLPEIGLPDIDGWEEYIAFRDWEYETFMDNSENMTHLEAIENYSFQYKYWLSPDKKTIYAFDKDGKIQFGYQRTRYIVFSSDTEKCND